MQSFLLVLTIGLLLVGAPQQQLRGQEKKTTLTGIKVQMQLEEINVKGGHSFLTGAFRITQPEGGELVTSKLVHIPVTKDAKIRIGDREGKLSNLKVGMSVALQLVEDQGGLVVVGIQTIGKGGQRDGKKDQDLIQGSWKVVKLEHQGKVNTKYFLGGTWVFQGNHLTILHGDKEVGKGSFVLDPAKKPKTIDIKGTAGQLLEGKTVLGIYRIEQNTLTICDGDKCPKEFSGAAKAALLTFERMKSK